MGLKVSFLPLSSYDVIHDLERMAAMLLSLSVLVRYSVFSIQFSKQRSKFFFLQGIGFMNEFIASFYPDCLIDR